MTQEKVTIIIPSNNGGRFVAEASDSVVAKTIAPAQIIVIDEGSTDDTHRLRQYENRGDVVSPAAPADAARHKPDALGRPAMKLGKNLLGGVCLSFQPLLLNALSVPAMAYIIRRLGSTAYGQWTMATALIGVLGILTNLGLRGAFIRQVAADPASAANALAEQLGLRMMLSLGAAALAIGFCWILKYPGIVVACCGVGAAAMVVTTFSTTLIDLLQAGQCMTTVAGVNLIAGMVLTASSVLVIGLGSGPLALSLAYLTGPLVSAMLLARIVVKMAPVRVRWGLRRAAGLFHASRSFTAQQLLNSASSYADALLLPRLIGATSFGFYTAGTLLPLRLEAIPDGLCTAAYPMLTQRFRDNSRSAVRLTCRYFVIILAVGLLMAFAASALAGPIAHILFPGSSQSCRVVILVTIWAMPLFGIENLLGCAINAAGGDRAQARASLPAALCNVTLTVILMSRMGIAGACIAMPLRHVVRIVMLTLCFTRWMGNEHESMPASSAVVPG